LQRRFVRRCFQRQRDRAKKLPITARADAMIDLFMFGGPSQMDLFDPKPLLTKQDGKKFPGKLDTDNAAGASGTVFGSPWKFSKHAMRYHEYST